LPSTSVRFEMMVLPISTSREAVLTNDHKAAVMAAIFFGRCKGDTGCLLSAAEGSVPFPLDANQPDCPDLNFLGLPIMAWMARVEHTP
jgi:hypothetical protein